MEEEIDRLERRIEELTGVDKLMSSEDKLRDLKEEISLLKHEYLDMQKAKKENGEQLDWFTNNDVFGPWIKSAIHDLKFWRDKYDWLLQKFETEEENESKR